jgi:hypothetical protein
MATMELGNTPSNRQPQPCASTFTLIQSHKPAECAFTLLRGNSRTLVTNRNGVAFTCGNEIGGDYGMRRTVLDGVGQQGAHEGVNQGTMAANQGLTCFVLEHRLYVFL